MTEVKVLKFPKVCFIETLYLIAVGLSIHGSLKQGFQWGHSSVAKASSTVMRTQFRSQPPVRNTVDVVAIYNPSTKEDKTVSPIAGANCLAGATK